MNFDEGTLFLQTTCNHRGGPLKFAGVAQLVVRQPADPKLRVAGPSPVSRSGVRAAGCFSCGFFIG